MRAGNGEWGMEDFSPQRSAIPSHLIFERLADYPNITQSLHPGEVAVVKLTLKYCSHITEDSDRIHSIAIFSPPVRSVMVAI